MTLPEALDIACAKNRPHCERYRELCDEANPDTFQRDMYRASIFQMAIDPEWGQQTQAATPESGHVQVGCCGQVLPS